MHKKVVHARLPSAGFRSWSQLLAVSLQVTWVMNLAIGCHYFPPGLQLPRPFCAWVQHANHPATEPPCDAHTHTHTHPFNGPMSRTTQVSRYQKGKTNLDFTGARDSEWQWHQLDHMQVCTSLQTDNHASTSLLSFYKPDAFPATQPTASKHWRQLRSL